ncbi:MAG: tryptophan--tRNA ligase [Neomegalonema sp.]|nr:tryptophan--tRNA ligase [Neomegalonema sp.]
MNETAAPARRHPPRVFSGVQPTGNLHLGNYLGAVREFVRLQDKNLDGVEFEHRFYCVVDLHAYTVLQDPEALRTGIRELTAAFLACGLDAKKSIIFNQSQVAEHAELAWIFNCVARIGWVNRMTQFKEKAGKNRENASVGLYAYPVLQAADILAYRATHVPIGEDQKQHLELSRDIAQKFNHDFGAEDFFPQPEPLIRSEAARVMSLRDGSKKMSKSEPSDMSRINLKDDADTIAQKIRKAKTDPEPLPDAADGLEERPEARNLVAIYAALSDGTVDDVLTQYAGKPFSEFKPALAELAIEKLAPIASELRRLADDPNYIDQVLADGAERAAAIAGPVLRDTYDLMGLLRTRS